VRIQCERCSTVYELDEARLPPGGAAVQCTRCRHVFRAVPPGAAGETLVGQPPAPAPPADTGSRTAVFAPPPRALRSDRPPFASPPAATPAGAETSAEEPSAAAHREGDTTLTRQVKATGAAGRRAWLGALALLVAMGLAAAGWAWWRSRVDPRALALREEAQAVLARDDPSSLERAGARLAAAAAADPGYAAARADLALTRLLLADDAADAVRPLEARFRALESERARLGGEKPPGWEAQDAAVVERMRAVQGEVVPLRERARALRDEALAMLRPLGASDPGRPEVARALALYHALDGDPVQASRLAPRPKEGEAPDAWSTVALATAALRGPGGTARARETVPSLEGLLAVRPELLRARLTLAQALAAAGRRDDAVAALDAILAANPMHDRARAYKAELLAPPPVALVPVQAPARAPPPRPAGYLPRIDESKEGSKGTGATQGSKAARPQAGKPRRAKAKPASPTP